MTQAFDDLPWHDAVILGIDIDRRRPGEVDEVVITVVWPDETRSTIRFTDCYALDARMNFGVVASESVRSAEEIDDDDVLVAVRSKWSRLGVDLSDVKCFAFETNSTASHIRVYARAWVAEPGN